MKVSSASSHRCGRSRDALGNSKCANCCGSWGHVTQSLKRVKNRFHFCLKKEPLTFDLSKIKGALIQSNMLYYSYVTLYYNFLLYYYCWATSTIVSNNRKVYKILYNKVRYYLSDVLSVNNRCFSPPQIWLNGLKCVVLVKCNVLYVRLREAPGSAVY